MKLCNHENVHMLVIIQFHFFVLIVIRYFENSFAAKMRSSAIISLLFANSQATTREPIINEDCEDLALGWVCENTSRIWRKLGRTWDVGDIFYKVDNLNVWTWIKSLDDCKVQQCEYCINIIICHQYPITISVTYTNDGIVTMCKPKKVNTVMINASEHWSNASWAATQIACAYHFATETKITASKIAHVTIIV